MFNLIQTEWLKIRKYRAFWWVMAITTFSYPGVIFIFSKIFGSVTHREDAIGSTAKLALGDPFGFPETWHTVAYASSLLVMIPAIVIIMLICNEYTFRTHRQNIIDGWGRSQFVTSKMIDVAIITLFITVIFTIIALITGLSNEASSTSSMWDQSYYIGLFALQTFAQLSLAFLAGFIVKRSFLALGIFLFYFLILENIITGIMRADGLNFYQYLPLEISDRLIPPPAFFGKLDMDSYQKSLNAIPLHIFLTIFITSFVWYICYRINNKRDLK
ncbi:MAG: ABC transporter permease [Bacteroidetes bacterium]|nr:ABC transporter permease [Bacteroidota bacterium]